MRVCIHCGNQVPEDAAFCPVCGADIRYNANREAAGGAYAQPQPRPAPAPADEYSPMSIAGFIVSFFSAIIGLILSILALNESKRTGSVKSGNFAKAGIIISSVSLGLTVLVAIVYVFILLVFFPLIII